MWFHIFDRARRLNRCYITHIYVYTYVLHVTWQFILRFEDATAVFVFAHARMCSQSINTKTGSVCAVCGLRNNMRMSYRWAVEKKIRSNDELCTEFSVLKLNISIVDIFKMLYLEFEFYTFNIELNNW